jgi:hypothetical protein
VAKLSTGIVLLRIDSDPKNVIMKNPPQKKTKCYSYQILKEYFPLQKKQGTKRSKAATLALTTIAKN